MGSTTVNKAGEKGHWGDALAAALVGLIAGLLAYGAMQFWAAQSPRPVLAVTLLYALAMGALSFFFLAARGRVLQSALCAAVIALILTPSTFHMARAATDPMQRIAEFPVYFWFAIAGPLCAYLLASLASGLFFAENSSRKYDPVFMYGLTQPLVALCAALFSFAGVALLLAGAFMLENFGIAGAPAAVQKPWVLLPALGALAGFSIVFIRSRQGFVGGLRFFLLLLSRFVMPAIAVVNIVLLVAIAGGGLRLVLDTEFGAAALTAYGLAGLFALNGVYQNGEAGAPAAWLRVSVMASAVTAPILLAIAVYGLAYQVGGTGLTPERTILIVVAGGALLYSLGAAVSLVGALNRRGERWMPLLAPFNMAMAAVWAMAFLVLASPLADPWALSARQQTKRLLNGAPPAEDFDFGYLKFKLGRHGDAALRDLAALADHPDAETIRRGAARALAAATPWDYENAAAEPARAEAPNAVETDGPMALPLNPVDNPARDEPAAKTPE
ncbi:MAG: hypothetical protein AAGJ73_15725 [Pseudomonadota bacterium]